MLTGFKALRSSALTCCALMALCSMSLAANTQDQTTAPPDNSATNKMHHRTADQQKENTSDRDLTRKIRRSLTKDKSLSTYAHNIKIITQDGAVTLKGPVHSEEEKQAIASKAAEIAGQDKVTNQLTVKQ